jgi:hypothetical protein
MGVIDGFLSGLKELVSVIETRSIAETTAANTRVDDLITAVEALTVGAGTIVVEAPNVTVRPNITVNCGCAGAGGSVAPQSPGEEGGTPPPGTTAPDAIDERKCKAATILIQDLIAYTNGMSALGLFNWTLDYSTLASILNGSMSQFNSGLLGIVAQVGGFLSAIQNLVFSGTFTADIPSVLSANQDAMVCALYNAQNVTDAKSEALAASGLTGFDANWVDTILTTNALNMLFFASGESESIISAYAGTADCGGCGPDCEAEVIKGAGDFTIGADGTVTSTISSTTGYANTTHGIMVNWACDVEIRISNIVNVRQDHISGYWGATLNAAVVLNQESNWEPDPATWYEVDQILFGWNGGDVADEFSMTFEVRFPV